MKRYKINNAQRVNTHASKSGIKWRYAGSTDDNWMEVVEDWMKWNHGRRWAGQAGIRITDTMTGKIVFEHMEEA